MSQLPVLVVGAGPTGMTAAMELQRMGVPVRLVDKAAGPSTTSRALAVQSRTVELMAQRGSADAMLALGNRGKGVVIHADGKVMAHLDLQVIPSRYNFILLLSQAETERLLREHLQANGVAVEFGTELVAFAQMGDEAEPASGRVSATLRRPDGSLEEVEAAYLICAEGAHSNVRRTLGLDFAGKSLENSYALADLHLTGEVPEDELSIFLSKAGLLAVFPMGGGRFRMIATEREAVAAGAPDPSLEEMQRDWDDAASLPARLQDMVWSSRFRINSRMLDRLRVGRVFFGGDAAHIHSPAGGQGMNTGMQDMVNLCWKVAMVYRGAMQPKLLDTYEAERLPVIRAVVRTTETATDAFQSRNPLLHQLITHVAPLALGTDFVQHKAARVVSQTGYSYADGPLADGARGVGELQPGDRVPDVEIAPGVWLHGFLDPSRFTLVLMLDGIEERAKDPLPVDVHLAPIGSDVAHPFGPEALFVLVRPDGYLAYTGKAGDERRMLDWLKQWSL